MPRSLRDALTEAAERVAPDMNAQDVAIILNAYSKLKQAAAEMPRSLRDALAEAAERVAPDMIAQGVANTLNAYSKLEEAAAEMPPTLRKALAEAAARKVPDMNDVELRMVRRRAPGRGVIENKHSTDIESPPAPPPCFCMSI